MAEEKLEHIEQLYKGLKECSVSALGPVWDDISPKVDRLNFFKLNLSTFNVF